MTTSSSSPAVYSTLAIQLTQSRPLSDEEKLFRDAFRAVENARRQSKKELPEFFENLRLARTIEDVHLALKIQKQRNPFWSRWIGSKWLEHLGKFAECILQYKTVVDSFMPRSQNIAGPIWSVFSFLFGVLKDLTQTTQDMKEIERTLEQSQLRFKRLFKPGKTLSEDLKTALGSYYEAVLEFAIDMHAEFSRMWISRYASISTLLNVVGAIPQAFHRTVKSRLSSLSGIIYKIIYDVDQGASYDRDDHVIEKINELQHTLQQRAGISGTATVSSPASNGKGLAYGLPPASPTFTGRVQYLSSIWSKFHSQPNGQICVALYGLGGIGKTQILRKYAFDNIKSNSSPQGYETILYLNAHDPSSIVAAATTFLRCQDSSTGSRSREDTDVLNDLREFLRRTDNWLLIFDNVRDFKHVHSALPEGSAGHILCSTRHGLVANQLTGGKHNSIEVERMGEKESLDLVRKLSEGASYDILLHPSTAIDVTNFARGIPLVIEQIIHNAIFAESTVPEVMRQVQDKTNLLKQSNISSLHEDNLSLGGVVMQAFDSIRVHSDRAEALFMLLAYMEPSSIPLSVVQDGARQFDGYLYRQCTYDRGSVEKLSHYDSDHERVVVDKNDRHDKQADVPQKSHFWEEVDPLNLRTLPRYVRAKSARKSHTRASLPLDDEETMSSLQRRCGRETALGRLFQDKVMINDAVVVLLDAGVIRKIGHNALWMHDLISEVAKALISAQPDGTGNHMGLAAAITVYLAYPVPYFYASGPKRLAIEAYLPHAIACQRNLKMTGIFNDSSVGPELSHIIASAIVVNGYLTSTTDFDCNPVSEEQRRAYKDQAFQYYAEAFVGYVAGWRRLLKLPGVDEKRIICATSADRLRESMIYNDHIMERYTRGTERFGRNAPWRAMQTALKLANLMELSGGDVDQAVRYTKTALRFYSIVFGTNDSDTISLQGVLYRQLAYWAQRWREAYTVSVQTLKNISKWDGTVAALASHSTGTSHCDEILSHPDGRDFLRCAGICCVQISRSLREESRFAQAVTEAENGLVYYRIWVRELERFYGEGAFELCSPMKEFAEAHELAGNAREAVSCYAKATCSAVHTVRLSPDSVLGHSERSVLETIQAFEQAKVRLLDAAKMEGNAAELDQYIQDAQEKVERWRFMPLEERTTEYKRQPLPSWDDPMFDGPDHTLPDG